MKRSGWQYDFKDNEFIIVPAIEFSKLPIDNVETHGPFPINYTTEFEKIFAKTIDIKKEDLLYLVNVKSNIWQHENEWRVILTREDLSIPEYSDDNLKDENRLVTYPKDFLKSIILGFKFFKPFLTKQVSSKVYEYTMSKSYSNLGDVSLRTALLNIIVEKKIAAKQIQKKDGNSFKIEAKNVVIEIIERDKHYRLTFH